MAADAAPGLGAKVAGVLADAEVGQDGPLVAAARATGALTGERVLEDCVLVMGEFGGGGDGAANGGAGQAIPPTGGKELEHVCASKEGVLDDDVGGFASARAHGVGVANTPDIRARGWGPSVRGRGVGVSWRGRCGASVALSGEGAAAGPEAAFRAPMGMTRAARVGLAAMLAALEREIRGAQARGDGLAVAKWRAAARALERRVRRAVRSHPEG